MDETLAGMKCGRLRSFRIRQKKKVESDCANIQWYRGLSLKMIWIMRIWLDLAFDIDNAMGISFGLVEQAACFGRQ